jgi:hypothetical protein
MSDEAIDIERVRREHVAQVHEGAHWAYLLLVPAVGFVLMVGLKALLATLA